MSGAAGDSLRAEAAVVEARVAESFERSDTDGFLSQWAGGLTADKLRRNAAIADAGGVAQFLGLWHGPDRVPARIIETRYGACWMLRDDARGLSGGRVFLPAFGGQRGRRLRSLGLIEAQELAPAEAVIAGRGRGLSGSAWVEERRTGCPWGTDARLVAAAAVLARIVGGVS